MSDDRITPQPLVGKVAAELFPLSAGLLSGCAVPLACLANGPKYDTPMAAPLPEPRLSTVGELGCGHTLGWKEYALELGLRYEEGRGVARDERLALYYYSMAGASSPATPGSLVRTRSGIIAVPGDRADPGDPEAIIRHHQLLDRGIVPASSEDATRALCAALRQQPGTTRAAVDRLCARLDPRS